MISDAELLKRELHYNPETGVFTRLRSVGRGKAGSVSGWVGGNCGHILIGFKCKHHRAHRLAWLYMTGEWPTHEIDHADNNPTNNAWSNLRIASRSDNLANRGLVSYSTSGLKGVSLHKRIGKWRSTIGKHGETYHLGYFDCPAAAHFAYLTEADKIFGAFARAA